MIDGLSTMMTQKITMEEGLSKAVDKDEAERLQETLQMISTRRVSGSRT